MRAILLCLLILSCPVLAQGSWQARFITTTAATSSYVGPGDVVTAADVYCGVRAYNNIKAVALVNALKLRRASDDATQNVAVVNAGDLNTAAAISFAGTDVTGSATSSGTTVALTGLASTAHVGDTITGVGYVGTYIVSLGALVAGAQTATTNTSQSIGVSAPVTLTWALYVDTCYDQGALGKDFVQATKANQPLFLPSAPGLLSKPAMVFSGSQWLASASFAVSQQLTMSMVLQRTSGTGYQQIFGGAGNNDSKTYFNNSANNVVLYSDGGVSGPGAMTDNAWHNLQTNFQGGSSRIVIDGASAVALGLSGGTTGITSGMIAGTNDAGTPTQSVNGMISEIILWHGGQTDPQMVNVNTNQGYYH